ncbi:MAG TPA: SusC/RagA family TonB-linked outer membrane protein [Gemmatirosa sp.]|nr:SusC/RagA family TonB-linked outer membrane protein [Gemmatirosa sp.]
MPLPRLARLAVARLVATVVATLAAARAAPAQERPGTVAGRVTDATTGQPVVAAQVSVAGTNLGSVTNDSGRYTLRGVPARPVTVRVIRIGFAERTAVVTVPPGGNATQDFALRQLSVTLAPVVTTVTGEQRRVEVGNAITRLDATALVQERQVSSVSDLLTARAAGVQVLPPNTTGAGARIRIRGVNSLSLSNDPIYVVDGVRITSSNASSSIDNSNTTTSRAADINPDEIETIEVVRGPSAATLYGTDAANGVIVITTKRGRAGRPQWQAYTEQGLVTDRNQYPTAYSPFGRAPTGAAFPNCFLGSVARGLCALDSVSTFNLFEDRNTTPIRAAPRQQYGLQVSGGSEAARYFVSGEWEDEVGRYRMPRVFEQQLRQSGTGVQGDWLRPNDYNRISGRVNLSTALSQKLDLNLSTGYIRGTFRNPPSDNNTIGLLSNALGGPGRRDNLSGSDSLYGYRTFTPERIFQNTRGQLLDRFIASSNANWRPRDWLAVRGNFGLDVTSRRDQSLCRFDECVRGFEQDLGFSVDNRASQYQYTVDLSATATRDLLRGLNSRTTLGTQFFNNSLTLQGATGNRLPPGGTTPQQGAVVTALSSNLPTRTLGFFAEETLAYGDRLFGTVGLRADDNSAFGADFGAVFYPKASLSWVVSKERFFGQPAWVDQLRLRAAWGASGNQPGTTDALRYFLARTLVEDQAEVPAITFGYLGDRSLKPERTQEFETGVDLTAFGGRLNVELTGYDKNSRDALVQRVLPPTTGSDSTVVFANIGQVRNRGLEAMVNVQLLRSPRLGWDVTLNGSTNANRIVDLGELPPIIGNTVDQREGYPLNAYWQRNYTYADADGNNLISRSEVQVDTTRRFQGYSIPRHEVTLQSGVDLFRSRVRLAGLVDYKGGHKLYNNTERIRCASRRNCRGLVDPRASLAEQARVIALTETADQSLSGFIEDASFFRLRELSLSATVPETWAARTLRARSARVTLAARNLFRWTDYSGIDPESNYNLLTDIPQDFQTIAPPTYYTVRVQVGF